MIIVSSIEDLFKETKQFNGSVGFVPTMGALQGIFLSFGKLVKKMTL